MPICSACWLLNSLTIIDLVLSEQHEGSDFQKGQIVTQVFHVVKISTAQGVFNWL